ncbi:MAG: hemolysin III family protein [Planctomycetota bacterium]
MDQQQDKEERINTITHALGIALSLVASAVILPPTIERGEFWLTVSVVVYLIAFLGVFTFSTLSHYYQDQVRRDRFRALDQGFIYIAIVATFTPFSAAYLRETWWLVMLGLIWVIAIAGFVSKIFIKHRINSVAISLPLILGWLPAVGGMLWADGLPRECMTWIVIGGVLYTVGFVFLFIDRRMKFSHAIWHLFVIVAAGAHFWGILEHVVRAGLPAAG